MAGIRLHTFWSILRNYVLEAIQTRTLSNFGAFYYMFIANVGLYKEPAFGRTKIHQKLNNKKTCIIFEKHYNCAIRLHRSSTTLSSLANWSL